MKSTFALASFGIYSAQAMSASDFFPTDFSALKDRFATKEFIKGILEGTQEDSDTTDTRCLLAFDTFADLEGEWEGTLSADGNYA